MSYSSINIVELAVFRARAKIVNSEAGLLALSLGGMAIGTDAPRTFAFLAMGTVVLFMAYRLQSFDRIYRLWREVQHPYVALRNVWKCFPIFNIGWLFLSLVAAGVLSKHGLFGVSPS